MARLAFKHKQKEEPHISFDGEYPYRITYTYVMKNGWAYATEEVVLPDGVKIIDGTLSFIKETEGEQGSTRDE